jgi:XRE family transcriptional regulator, regulator of sulfur utilization
MPAVPSVSSAPSLTLDMVGERVRAERLRRKLTLDALSRRARVSRSMVSAIERGAKAPTVLVLDRIATALGTSLARLFQDETQSAVIVLRRNQQPVAHDPSGWERRILSPALAGVEFEFMRTTLGPRVDAGVFMPHAPGSREYVAIEQGALLLTLNGVDYLLEAGDSIYYDGHCEHGFKNPRSKSCVYYLAMDVSGDPRGTKHRPVKPAMRPGTDRGKSSRVR